MTTPTLRHRIADILEAKKLHNRASQVFDWFLIALILLNVFAVVIGTMHNVQQQYGESLYRFEIFSVTVFTIEYFLRIWASVETDDSGQPAWKVRLKYFFSPMALVDLIAILPFYLSLLFSLDLRFLRILRLLRVIKLGRYSSAMQLLYEVFKQEYKVMVAALMWLLVLMIIASSGIYLIEHDVQPEAFGSIPHAMWWAMATLTTVGYGDVTPITPLGKFFGGSITVISMAMVALPAGILASSFSEQLRKRRDRFRARVKAALADGVLDHHELEELERLRKELGMEKEDAQELLSLINLQRRAKPSKHCPHCGKAID